MVVSNISSIGVRIVLFGAFLTLLTVFPRFCTRAPEPQPPAIQSKAPPPAEGPMAGGIVQKMTPTVVGETSKQKFNHVDRRKVQEEAMMLEWEICQEEEPLADECQLTGVVVTPTNDGRAVAKIFMEYWYSSWASDRPKRRSVTRYYERWADGWALTEPD